MTLRFKTNLLEHAKAVGVWAEAFLEYSLEGIEVATPTLVLSRVATAPDAARLGLFALLRYANLQALPQTPLASVVAITYEGAPHVGSMRDAGYAFFEPRAAWDSEAVARTRPLLAVLPRAHFERAFSLRAADMAGRLGGVQLQSAAVVGALRRCCQVT